MLMLIFIFNIYKYITQILQKISIKNKYFKFIRLELVCGYSIEIAEDDGDCGHNEILFFSFWIPFQK